MAGRANDSGKVHVGCGLLVSDDAGGGNSGDGNCLRWCVVKWLFIAGDVLFCFVVVFYFLVLFLFHFYFILFFLVMS